MQSSPADTLHGASRAPFLYPSSLTDVKDMEVVKQHVLASPSAKDVQLVANGRHCVVAPLARCLWRLHEGSKEEARRM